MGYSHYWKSGANLSPAVLKDIRKIIKTSPVPLKVKSLTGSGIDLNGKGEDGYEDFVVWPGYGTFVKTGYRPYDEVVCAILLRLAEDGLEISSDGNWDSAQWVTARLLFTEALGREAEKPEGV
jgi:hypothetical protein